MSMQQPINHEPTRRMSLNGHSREEDEGKTLISIGEEVGRECGESLSQLPWSYPKKRTFRM